MGRDATTSEVNAAAATVGALQIGLGAAGGAVLWLAAGNWSAISFAAGCGCALGGTLAYAFCVAATGGRKRGDAIHAHLLAQVAKIAVSVTLLIAGLNASWQLAPAAYIAGFGAGVMVYPFALLLVNRKMDSN